jgi:3-dehydroquinate synthase
MTEMAIKTRSNCSLIYFGKAEGFNAVSQLENVVTDQNVFDSLGERLMLTRRKDVIIIPAGEQSKTSKTYDELVDKLLDAEEVVALGGGVITDLVGHVASTLRRGISLINIPTSLVGMVDAAIGGKNGINKGERKNYLGTFYQPDFVIVDPSFLRSLPKKEFRDGVAEIIKYGAISGKDGLIDRCSSPITLESLDLEWIITECINTKKYLVEKDESDKTCRRALNFGHTIGHSIEIPYSLSHGEAIAIGQFYEAELAERRGIYNSERVLKIQNALRVNGLPTRLPAGADIDKMIQLMKKDKKGSLVFAFSKYNYSDMIPEKEVREVLNETKKD